MPAHMPLKDALRMLLLVAATPTLITSLSACSSLLNESAAAGGGIAGTAIAGKVTHNATVAAGIGFGALAAANAGVQYLERDYHGDEQDRIAQVAGALAVGQVASWESHHTIQVDPNQHGRVTVSRVISSGSLNCKEIVFSVDATVKHEARSSFYIAAICADGQQWKWASAEPATARWGSLQ